MDSSHACQTPDYWRKFWVCKLSKKLSQEQTDIQDINNYIRIVNTYLEENPGNPRGISVCALKKFIAKYSALHVKLLHVRSGLKTVSQNCCRFRIFMLCLQSLLS